MNNLEIVQDAYDRFGKGDVAGLITLLSDDVHWEVPEIENSKFGGKCQGHAAVGDFFESLSADEDLTLFEPREFITEGNRVVVLGRSAATVKPTGRKYETEWVHVFNVSNGLITAFHEFFDNAAATRAFQKATNA